MLPRIPHQTLGNTTVSASRLVLGTSPFGRLEAAEAVFDRFLAAGGNFFDTAHVYGRDFEPGCCERTLGTWIRQRGVRRDLVILGKGGHPPNTRPDSIELELEESLERLGTEYLDIYMLHRDSPDVPVGEFVELLHSLLSSNRVRAYGFSNWTLPRVEAAREYAKAKGRSEPIAVSNQLSLAVMERPIYPGCVGASDISFRAWFAATGVALLPWASQGRGVFTAIAEPTEFASSRLAEHWYSERNLQRLVRARQLATERGVHPVNVALAWVLNQPFPTFPIFGPRSVVELESSLGALNVSLTTSECAWLNLENGDDPRS